MLLSRDIADYPDGLVLAVDKPWRWTSADVIRKIKYAAIRHFGKKNLKVGHAGTLDPLATGVLLVCIGNACKRARELQDHDKSYRATLRLGATTPSYDLEKEPDRTFPDMKADEASLRAVLPSFVGEQEQIAPLFSAKSVDGVRAYEMARKLYRSQASGAVIDSAALESLQRSRIVISRLELVEWRPCRADAAEIKPEREAGASGRIHVADTSALGLADAVIDIDCSKGTYIRALARDIGEALGGGAHLSGLVRTRSGDYTLENAVSLEQALEMFERN